MNRWAVVSDNACQTLPPSKSFRQSAPIRPNPRLALLPLTTHNSRLTTHDSQLTTHDPYLICTSLPCAADS